MDYLIATVGIAAGLWVIYELRKTAKKRDRVNTEPEKAVDKPSPSIVFRLMLAVLVGGALGYLIATGAGMTVSRILAVILLTAVGKYLHDRRSD